MHLIKQLSVCEHIYKSRNIGSLQVWRIYVYVNTRRKEKRHQQTSLKKKELLLPFSVGMVKEFMKH